MSRKPRDLTGQNVGTLTVKSYAGKVGKYPSWWCECKCGKIFTVPAYNFRQGDVVGCPYCQTHVEATSILWQGQRITVIPQHCHNGRPIEYLGELVKQLTNNSDTNAVLIMLESTPSESLQGLGAELTDTADEADFADSAAEEWENNTIHFDKPLDK
jgi:hypothetical protein